MRNRPLSEIARRLNAELPHPDLLITGYQVDSRSIHPGELFFALKGERSDGHCHLSDVKGRGGVAAIVSSEYEGPDHDLVLIRVPDVLASLQGLAHSFAQESNAQVVAVTGTMGKTTTKDFIAAILEKKFRVGKTYSSYNTRLTLPVTVLNMQGDEEIWVLEMGMGEPGDIGKLVEIASPDIAVLTQIAFAHYGESFPEGLPAIAKAKAEIFNHPKTRLAIYAHALGQYPEMVQSISCQKATYSIEERSADYFLSSLISEGESSFVVDERGVRAYRFTELPFQQTHVLHNLMGAMSVARALKMEWDEINQALPSLRLPKMRFEVFERDGIVFINDAYNANPESVKAALSACPQPKNGGKKIAVLGRMVDLGPHSRELHEEVGRFAQARIDTLLTFADEAVPLNAAFAEGKKPAEHFSNFELLVARLQELMHAGDVVLVKGSRDLQMERIFERLNALCCSS